MHDTQCYLCSFSNVMSKGNRNMCKKKQNYKKWVILRTYSVREGGFFACTLTSPDDSKLIAGSQTSVI